VQQLPEWLDSWLEFQILLDCPRLTDSAHQDFKQS
jgi:hypothetical protein